ncbi:ornithine cyclodeaminase family protein [Filibacter tadaridae]|uniref:L-lysine cyclodeaminase n=1 Tax=Filibacter tadaridae TaxID=2483811 RepID=A0A3P5XH87_9BACL|nr:ornithine cyclodeaminase family protein [Filibacter tadaridae]VDC29513.1 L-lysine cyclodeaminase [Filibacter tadaridae]
MMIISAEEQRRLIDMKEVIEQVEIALQAFSASKTDTPIRTSLPFGKENAGLVMPSVAEELEAMGLKYVTVVPGNAQVEKKVIHGVVLLSDIKTGEPLALLEGSYLTQIRTGALSGAATKYLARDNATRLGIIGTGQQSGGLCEAIFAVRDIQAIYIYNRSEEKAKKFSTFVKERFGKEVVICKHPDEVVQNCDVLVTATTSMSPVFSEKLQPGIHVNAVGSFKPTMQELPSHAIQSATKVVVESLTAAMEETGDLQVPIQEGVFSENDIHAELGKIISGVQLGRTSAEEITVFKSVGLAVVDIIVAKYIYEKALSQNAGVLVEL